MDIDEEWSDIRPGLYITIEQDRDEFGLFEAPTFCLNLTFFWKT